ncbi:hypothetical protein IIA16_06370 [bacterium]|nr:hypothetical protein [bacterium]
MNSRAAFTLLALALFAGCNPPVRSDRTLLFIVSTEPDEVLVVDADAGRVVRRFLAGEGLTDIEVVPARGLGFVSSQHGEKIVVIDLARGAVIRDIPVGGMPTSLAAHPNGEVIYAVVNSSVDLAANGISAFSVDTGKLVGYVEVGSMVHSLRISPDGGRLYVLRANAAFIIVVDTESLEVVNRRQLSHSPSNLAVSPTGLHLAVTLTMPDTVQIYDAAAEELLMTLPVGDAPKAVAFSEDGLRVLGADLRTRFVHIGDLATGTTVGKIRFDMAPTLLEMGAGNLFVGIEAPILFSADPITGEVTRRISLNSKPKDFEVIGPGEIVAVQRSSSGGIILLVVVGLGGIALLVRNQRARAGAGATEAREPAPDEAE